MAKARGLKFCPETNDLLYPRENKETRKLEYFCKNCDHVEPAEPAEWCVWSSETTFSAKDKTVVDYTEPGDKAGPVKLSSGTFALQAHDPGSTVYYRNIRVKRLP